ncbi:MAG: hypothetical protein LBK82_03730 [Planctomycetaceae bacterium]|jgi:hypothetical protein|nr:hypothetical protein [Planctomycetaceae bacterium]
MKKSRTLGISTISCILFSVTVTVVTAQETSVPSGITVVPSNTRLQLEKAEQGSPAMNGLKVDKKITGRLPNGYRNIVSDNKQRDKMYSVQKEYIELIELLKIRIELLEWESALQVDALLTSDQVQKVKETNGALESERLFHKNQTKPKQKPAKENSQEFTR